MTQTFIQHGISCPVCGDHVNSNSRHDMESCLCGAVFIDGGWDYRRVGFEEAARGAIGSVTRTVDRAKLPWFYEDEPGRREKKREYRDAVPTPA